MSKREKRVHAVLGTAVGMYLLLGQNVELCATLKPAQWELIGGAMFIPSRDLHLKKRKPTIRRGKIRIPAAATLEEFLPERSLTFDLSYPLCKVARVTIHPYTRVGYRNERRQCMTVGYVLGQLARAYKEIYRKHAKYGVWGHAIGDLCFESLRIVDNVGDVCIGS